MTPKRFAVGVALGFLISGVLSSATQAAPITLNFSNLDSTAVNFAGSGTGASFNFSSNAGYQFSITSVNGGVGDSVGLDGYVAGGPYTYTTASIITNGGIETAPVTGTGMLHITDANNVDLTGTVNWLSIATLGVGGILDLSGTINLTGISYSGTNSDLTALAAPGAATDVVTFQFVPAQNLMQLAQAGANNSTSYSGSISVTPEPASAALIGIGLMSLLGMRKRSK